MGAAQRQAHLEHQTDFSFYADLERRPVFSGQSAARRGFPRTAGNYVAFMWLLLEYSVVSYRDVITWQTVYLQTRINFIVVSFKDGVQEGIMRFFLKGLVSDPAPLDSE